MNAGQSDHRWERQKKYWNIVKALRAEVHAFARARFQRDIEPSRTDTSKHDSPTFQGALTHVLWMCLQTDGFISDLNRREEKVNRWIGFVQGVLWVTGVMSIDHMRKINKTEVP